jgi:hypothetical protein
MILKVVIDDRLIELNLPASFLEQAQDFFAKMDADMDRGWQVNREWVESPDRLLRAQIAADKLLTALENENENLGRLMAGYILSRVPEIESLELNPAGETRDHRIGLAESIGPTASPPPATAPVPGTAGTPQGLDKMAALAQAAKDVSKVFKTGRHYHYSVYNHATGAWEESPAIADKAQAEALREQAFKTRFEALKK